MDTTPVTRFEIVLPPDQQQTLAVPSQVAISPDGSLLAYTVDLQLFLRPLNQMRATHIRGIEGAVDIFFSPDGQWLGFFQDNQLKKVAVTGGAPLEVHEAPGGFGASWSAGNTIVLGQATGITKISSVSGGVSEVLISLDASSGERGRDPQILPGGHSVIFTLETLGAGEAPRIVVQSLETGERNVLVNKATEARYLTTGHLVYAQAESLFAVPFDLTLTLRKERREVTTIYIEESPTIVVIVAPGLKSST